MNLKKLFTMAALTALLPVVWPITRLQVVLLLILNQPQQKTMPPALLLSLMVPISI